MFPQTDDFWICFRKQRKRSKSVDMFPYTDDINLIATRQAEVERLLALGARRKAWDYPEGADYVVLEDPDGNPFCVVRKG